MMIKKLALAMWVLPALLVFAALTVLPASAAGGSVTTNDTFTFSPKTINITVGSTVNWVNPSSNSFSHTVDADSFSCGNIDPGDSCPNTFNTVGTFNYICSYHESSGMTGTVVVKAASTPTPTPSASPSKKPTPKPTSTPTASPTVQQSTAPPPPPPAPRPSASATPAKPKPTPTLSVLGKVIEISPSPIDLPTETTLALAPTFDDEPTSSGGPLIDQRFGIALGGVALLALLGMFVYRRYLRGA